jgi:Rrf2 family transcriptional regulator, nitric oxide-sensitive transcriptional repressor
MISQTAEYALRAMVVLLDRDNPANSYLAAQDIAARAKVPVDYMAKILNALGKGQLVTAQRGRNGGCRAARIASEITVLDIIQAVDPIRRIETCPLGIASHGTHLCPLHRKLDDAIGTVEQAFRCTTIAELLSESTPSKPLCESMRTYHVQGAA